MLLRGDWQAGEALLKARDAADRLRDQIREVVGYLVEHAVEMRDVFLNQPTVVQLLGEN